MTRRRHDQDGRGPGRRPARAERAKESAVKPEYSRRTSSRPYLSAAIPSGANPCPCGGCCGEGVAGTEAGQLRHDAASCAGGLTAATLMQWFTCTLTRVF